MMKMKRWRTLMSDFREDEQRISKLTTVLLGALDITERNDMHCAIANGVVKFFDDEGMFHILHDAVTVLKEE